MAQMDEEFTQEREMNAAAAAPTEQTADFTDDTGFQVDNAEPMETTIEAARPQIHKIFQFSGFSTSVGASSRLF